MRIVGGEWRGRRLTAPRGLSTRPTSDRVREAVFDVLQSLLFAGRLWPMPADKPVSVHASADAAAGPLAGFTVADLYAGSGAVGLEALSRGAATCTFVEPAAAALVALRHNIATVGVAAERARVLARPVSLVLRDEVAARRRYTLLFADPPYATYAEQEDLLVASLSALLSTGGVAVVETARRIEPHLSLTCLASKVYGDTRVTFLALPS